MTGPAGRPARGRRDNGLDARDFVPLIDVDPRVGEHLLDVLALAGIAAYLQPSSDLNPVIRSTTLPSRPTDRLWADRRYANEARNLLAQHEHEAESRLEASGEAEPESTEEEIDVDAAWEQIVAGYHDESAATTTPAWPSAEETGEPDEDRSPGTAQDSAPATAVRSNDLRPSGPPTPGPRDHVPVEPSDDDDLGETDDEGYTPPPPPPLPRPTGHVILGVVSVLVGFLLFFRPDLLGIGQDLTMVLGVFGVLGGAGLLVYQLRDGLSATTTPTTAPSSSAPTGSAPRRPPTRFGRHFRCYSPEDVAQSRRKRRAVGRRVR